MNQTELLLKLNMPNFGDVVYVLTPCKCIKEKHKCSPDAIGSTTLQILPIKSENKIRECDNWHFTRQYCYRLYERKFQKHHISQWGTKVFRTKEDALNSIGKKGNYYDNSNKSINN